MGSSELRDAGTEGMCEMMSGEQEGELSENGPVSVERPDDRLEGCELAAVLEALLFVSPEPVSLSRLVTAVGSVSKAEVEQALMRLEQDLAQDNRGIQLVKLAGG